MNPSTVGVPYSLDFDGVTAPGQLPRFKPGRGRAGYTVVNVPRESLRAFLDALPRESWLPGTHRLAAELAVQS